ncbi:TonB-dependent receptor [Asticcacaulis solisilvae]|uniref:TonB-dependent receptor n=1 Tax=Asticcacaulis solisilvae TaxID=1217274 RepID=UPI003FD72644
MRGRSDHQIGKAATASEGSVSGDELALRPLLRPGELLEVVPGLMVTQHSGGGKANQYFLRGFDLDHGTDFSVLIDNMPMNLPSNGHGQGYLDVNGLIPEAVERIDYRKGPYRADGGDFSFVGQARLTTRDTVPAFLTVESGSGNYGRLVLGDSGKLGGGDLLGLLQVKSQDGPWTLPEHFRSVSGFVKYSRQTPAGLLKISLSTYDSRWRPTDQIPGRAVGTVLSSAFDTLDPWLRGHTRRQILTANLSGGDARSDWHVGAWAQAYDWSLLSNFTYYLDDPVNGDEIRQFDRRTSLGGKAERSVTASDRWTFTYGAQARLDDIPSVGLWHTKNGADRALESEFAVHETALSAYGEGRFKAGDHVDITAGLRGDAYDFRTAARGGAAWSGKVSDSLVSPKLGISYRFGGSAALYANWGQGFHSNDARGVTNPADPSPGLVKGSFDEIGGRYERGSLRLAAVWWRSHIDSELVYSADSGTVEPDGAARRKGYEISAFWKPVRRIDLDAVYARNDGTLEDEPAGADAIPGAVRETGELGLTFRGAQWDIGGRIRYLGPRDLIEDRSEVAKSSTLVNLRGAWHATERLELYAEILNAFDRPAHDIDYYYATRLPGEPADGVADRTFHMAEPREIRLGLKIGI